MESSSGARVLVGGMLTAVKTMYPKTGRNKTRKMARFKIEDFEGSVSGVIFSEMYSKCQENVEEDRIVFVEGTLDQNREDPSVKIDRVIPIERAFQELAGCVGERLSERRRDLEHDRAAVVGLLDHPRHAFPWPACHHREGNRFGR